MSKLRIFIEGKELDSLDSVTVPITKQFEELSDPTVICNDYSKTVTVPLSKNNNEIFGHCYNPDRLIVAGSEDTPLVGIYFDPYKKLECRLQWGDDVFFTGYAKMLKVTNKGYEVTINGELGKIFQELQKITFDKTKYEDEEDIAKYWIDGSVYVDTVINGALIFKCWNSEQDDYTLRKTTDSNYDITDIIGFLPNNSFSTDFDYKTYEYIDSSGNYVSTTFQEALDYPHLGLNYDKTFEEYTGCASESVIGDGLYPVQYADFRSYEQIPFIYWNKFWQIFQKKAEEVTGYKWDCSDAWFLNNSNYKDLAITLLQRDAVNFTTESKTDSSFGVTINKKVYSNGFVTNNVDITVTKSVDGAGYNVKFSTKPSFTVTYTTLASQNTAGFTYRQASTLFTYGGLIVTYKWTDSNGTTDVLKVGFCSSKTLSTQPEWGNALFRFKEAYPNLDAYYGVDEVKLSSQTSVTLTLEAVDTLYGSITTKGSGGTLHIEVEQVRYYDPGGEDLSNNGVFYSAYQISDSKTVSYPSTYTMSALKTDASIYYYKTNFRSGDSFTLNDICNFDFSNILDYCKRYRINIYIDELNKKLIFTRHLFDDYTIEDFSDKIDATTFEVSPVTFDMKYLLFSYADSDTQIGTSYKNKYNYPYGTKRITTDYNFGTESKTLFEKSKESILYSPSYIAWNNLFAGKLIFQVRNNNFIECRDEDGKTKDISGAYFYPAKKKIDTGLTFFVSDDTDKMRLLNKYYYNGTYDNRCILTNYWTQPELVLQIEGALPIQYHTCLFTKPAQSYVAQMDYFSRINRGGIYETIWKTYLNERYNVQNKKVTTYVRLSPSDFINFNFNQFWKIGNQVYVVNKIYDYDITSDKPTKVDLITVQNINAYKN